MCGSVEYGKCEICGKEAVLERTYFHYGLKCDCHSPEHFDMVLHCEDCVPKPPERTKVTFTREQALSIGALQSELAAVKAERDALLREHGAIIESDVVVIQNGEKKKAYFADRVGFWGGKNG